MAQSVRTYAMQGGLDTNSAALAVAPEALIYGLNYEPLAEGYGRVEGYERFDGRTAPSAMTFHLLSFDGGIVEIAEGDTVTGATSGATGQVIVDPHDVSGTWGVDAAGTLVLVNLIGTFQDNEALNVSGTPHATVNGLAVEGDAPSDDLYQTWLLAAQAGQRALIAAVPGSGPVRGVAVHSGDVYAWRDDAGATKLVCHRATTAGWVEVGAVYRMNFTTGVGEILPGQTVTGATSGATGVVVQVQVDSGTWGGGDAAGRLFIKSITGTFASENIQVGGVTKAAGAAVTAQYPSPGGRVRWLNHNFYGAADRYRLYGCNGTGKGFELVPGAGMCLIDTGMTDDRPQRIFEIKNHLGFTFPGGSIQFSGTLEPLQWTVILGAGEIGFGTEITDVLQATETAVAFFGENKIAILEGSDANDFVLNTLTEEAGADIDTAQRVGTSVYIDRRGLRSLSATQAFGNFKTGTLSGKFEAYFKSKRAAGARAIGSIVCKTKSHYRLFWDDGTGLAVYMGGKEPQAIPFELGLSPSCFGSGEMDDGEAMFVGDEDGFVYRLDSGTSFDGEPITAACMTPFNHFGSTMQEKRIRKVTLEMQGPSDAQISILAQFNYGDLEQPIDDGKNFSVRGGGGLWDVANWDEFSWSDALEGVAECHIDGLGRNASFVFATTAGLLERPHILQAYSVHFSPRRMKR